MGGGVPCSNDSSLMKSVSIDSLALLLSVSDVLLCSASVKMKSAKCRCVGVCGCVLFAF